MDTRTPQIVDAVRPPTSCSATTSGGCRGSRRTGRGRRRRPPPAARERGPGPGTPFEDVVEGLRREGLLERPPQLDGEPEETPAGTGRVTLTLHARPTARCGSRRESSVFDAASWNGIAIDSTCGGHGTCHKCRSGVDGRHRRRDPPRPADLHRRAARRRAGGSRASSRRRTTCGVEVPPLTTRPKAATVGVGRQVILRPAVQKRYVELDGADARRPAHRPGPAARRRRRPRARRADLHVLRRLPTVLRQSDFKVTAVVVDETLVDVEPGDTTGSRYAIAFDLGTTTVVATLLDLEHGHPGGGLVDAQPAAALRRRRDHPDQRHDDGPGRAGPPADACPRDAGRARRRGVRRGRRSTRPSVYEVAVAGNATMTALLLGIDPEPLGVAPFVMVSAQCRRCSASDIGLTLHPGARVVVFPALGRVRRRRHRRRDARDRHGPRQAHAALHRRRHELRDRAQRRRDASSPPPPRPGRRSRAGRSAAACAPPTARSR